MDFLLPVVIVLLVLLAVLYLKYDELKNKVVERANEMFIRWRNEELERAAVARAQILFEQWRQRHEEQIRRDAIEKSRAVITGKVAEHLVPFSPLFHYNPKDVRFIGSPIDLIVFDGLSEGNLRKIVFVEVKTGKSTLSERERKIMEAIKNRRVEWEEIRI